MTSYKPDPLLAGPLYGQDPWPLRFHTHSFDAACFNTLACSIIYDSRQFGTRKVTYNGDYVDKPSGIPPFETWRDKWTGHHVVVPHDGRTFRSDVEIEWSSLDGRQHVLTLSLDQLFEDRLVLHNVSRNEVKDGWLKSASLEPVSPDILVEVNDNVVSVYMRALVATEASQTPGNPRSHFRDDLILAWTHSY